MNWRPCRCELCLSTIANSYATGTVNGSGNFVGGLVGYNGGEGNSSITNSYASGNVSGSSNVGGLVGYNEATDSISNSFATSTVSGSSYVGGLVGYNNGSTTIDNSYYTDSGHENGIGIFELGGTAAFYSPLHPVYAIGTTGGWDVFTPIWDTYTDELPHLHWEHHAGDLTPYWVGTNSSDFDLATNWSDDSVPGIGSTAIIFSGTNEPTLSATTTLANLIVGSGTFTQDGALTLTGLYAQGGGTFDQNANFSSNNFSQSGGTFVSDTTKTFTVGNSFSLSGGTFSRFTGLGTGIDPYLIYDVYGLQGMGGFLSNTFGLANDIDASETSNWNVGAGFIPIGNNSIPFTGTFNGNNYTISDLFINLPSTNYVGLFGYTSGSTIENVGLINANVMGQYKVGALVGLNGGSIVDYSYATGSVSGSNEVGGLVGYNFGSSSIDNSYATGSVSGSTRIGGLVGGNCNSSSIANSYATGSVNGGSGSFAVGGLVGYNLNSSSIANSYATGSVNAGSGSFAAGGLVGYNTSSSNIDNSYATGSVSGVNNVGGLVGYSYSSSIDNSYASGNVSGSINVGGLVGGNYNSSSIANSYSAGSVSGSNDVGGLVGANANSNSITNSYATGSVSGSSNVGGLIGNDDGTNTLTNNWWYNSMNQGIGNNVSNTSLGHWQEAGSVSDFYSPAQSVYAIGTPGEWDIFTPIWDTYTDELPHLHWENHSGNFTPYWLGTISSDFDMPANWSDDSVPGIDSTAIILSGTNEPTLSTTTTLADLIMGSGTFTQNAALTLSGSYVQAGGTYDQNANFSIGSNFSQDAGAFVSDPTKTFTVGNSFSLSGGTFSRFTGLGTSLDPYLIYDVYGLQGMGGFLSSSFGLANDIDASSTPNWNYGAGFTPIGNNSTPFTGTFNGNNYTISDLLINLPTTNDVGLFGETSGANIDNVGLFNDNITGQWNVGGLVGSNN